MKRLLGFIVLLVNGLLLRWIGNKRLNNFTERAIVSLYKDLADRQDVTNMERTLALQIRYRQAYGNQDLYDQAIADITTIISLADEEEDLTAEYQERAYFYSMKKDWAKAAADYAEAIKRNPTQIDNYTEQANCFQHLLQWDKVITAYSQAIKYDPNTASHYFGRGYGYFQGTFDYPKAIADYLTVLALEPDNIEAHNYLAMIYNFTNNVDLALKEYDQIIQLDPSYAEGFSGRGMLLSKQGRYLEAIKDFSQALELEPDGGSIYNNRAMLYFDLGKMTEALQDINQAITLWPEEVFFHANKALILMTQGQLDQALAASQQAIVLNPKYAPAYENQGLILLKQGNLEEAKVAFKQALLAPFNANRAKSLYGLFVIETQQNNMMAAQTYEAEALESNPQIKEDFIKYGIC